MEAPVTPVGNRLHADAPNPNLAPSVRRALTVNSLT